MKHDIADHLVETAQNVSGIDACVLDIEKLYCRLRQLEARVANQTKSLQANLEGKTAQLAEEHNSLGTKVDKHNHLLDDLSSARRSSEDELRRLVAWIGIDYVEGEESFSSSLTGRCAKLEVSLPDICDRYERQLNEHIASAGEKLQKLSSEFADSYEETTYRLKTQGKINGQRFREIDGKVASTAKELKEISNLLVLHGLSITTDTSISERAGLAEIRVAALENSLHALDVAFKESCETSQQGLHDVNMHLEDAKLEAERFAAVEDQCHAISKMVQDLQKQIGLDAGDDPGHLKGETEVQETEVKKTEVQKTKDPDLQNLEKELNTLSPQVQSLLRWQEGLREDVNKVLRLGRIVDDKVEAFDVVENRMEELWDQVRGLENNGPMLENNDPQGRACGRAAQRSPSPKQASGAWWNRVLKPDEHFASPNFDGTGWAKSPPRRPYSAGAACNADKPQQPQSQPPQSAQKLPPGRPYSAGAACGAEKPQQPLLQPHQHHQSGQPRMPPTLGSVLGGVLAPPVSGMHTFCRTGAQATSPKMRAVKRPMSARAASDRCA